MLPKGKQMIVVLAGGVGGAKMAHGFQHLPESTDLTVVVNTADDFELNGLKICPDLDTVLYTLAGVANPLTGWGITGDTRIAQGAMTRLGVDPWFILGDQDLATHIVRTQRLRGGATLAEVTAAFAKSLDIGVTMLPMTNDPVATMVETTQGTLDFQEYFVRRQQQDDVLSIAFDGIEQATAAPGVLEAIADAEVIVFAPSNPIVSIGPILGVPGVKPALAASTAIKVAISPIVGGNAIKGPAAKMLATLGHDVSASGVARLFNGIIDGFVIDRLDSHLAEAIEATGIAVSVLQSIMGDRNDRARFAGEVLAFARMLKFA